MKGVEIMFNHPITMFLLHKNLTYLIFFLFVGCLEDGGSCVLLNGPIRNDGDGHVRDYIEIES